MSQFDAPRRLAHLTLLKGREGRACRLAMAPGSRVGAVSSPQCDELSQSLEANGRQSTHSTPCPGSRLSLSASFQHTSSDVQIMKTQYPGDERARKQWGEQSEASTTRYASRSPQLIVPHGAALSLPLPTIAPDGAPDFILRNGPRTSPCCGRSGSSLQSQPVLPPLL